MYNYTFSYIMLREYIKITSIKHSIDALTQIHTERKKAIVDYLTDSNNDDTYIIQSVYWKRDTR